MDTHNIRILDIKDVETALKELKKIKPESKSLNDVELLGNFNNMAEKSVLRCIKIYNIKLSDLNILKQAVSDCGANLFVSEEADVIIEGKNNIILSATLKQLNSIYYKLKSEDRFELSGIAEEMKKVVLNFEKTHGTVIIQGKEFDFSGKTYIMGILNITPDSFSDGGKYVDVDLAVERALEMIEEGADIIDIGAESTRPGAKEVTEQEELDRILPVVKALLERTDAVISIDTFKSNVAKACLELGVGIINDISGLKADEKMAEVISDYDAYCILMHMQGTPRTMQKSPYYGELVADIIKELRDSLKLAELNGVKSSKIMLDPGIGFGKTQEHNLQIINNLKEFKILGKPLLVGASRKSFIGNILGADAGDRLEGSIASAVISSLNGANVIRVHDVKETAKAIKVTDEIKNIR